MGQHCSSAEVCTDLEPRSISPDTLRSLSSQGISVAPHVQVFAGGRRFSDDYEVEGTVLGHGLCGDVVLAIGKAEGGRFALKSVQKKSPDTSSRYELTSEVEIYLTLNHPNIAQLHGVYESPSMAYLLMECCEGGELYARLQQRVVFSDTDAAEATKQMLSAVAYLHSCRVVHRDLKLENFLYDTAESSARLKLIDFGFAHVWDGETPMRMPCGSISYVSPDVLLGQGYTDKCDLWSLGVIVWMLLSGYPPFHGLEWYVVSKIKAGEPDWSYQKRWKHASNEAVDLVRKLLLTDPQKRPGAAEALRHPWLMPGSSSRETLRRQSIAGA
mmetsp:Transcript_32446/g.75384  ORF Transcript_32446/g.75384 Transcript_32446/m.75384 type:complete len:328 (-) Transcript_32446:92-1075(-)|eukprot:CAMPEP_0171100018 /NCGR_PEP_ID=MMETSP0766_2-20121228/52707_1 /TAXON_ID=439317 /ORGANISM="Gambierdiscus australes, Strain CAWD 149" /LENGTH=327 /DNA_ID=CAMNT_0011559767 /DNA_START=63 /DNA_END=1046 /DNA_ORIENTATION=+